MKCENCGAKIVRVPVEMKIKREVHTSPDTTLLPWNDNSKEYKTTNLVVKEQYECDCSEMEEVTSDNVPDGWPVTTEESEIEYDQ